ncbi:MAG: hypothetical protein JEY99_15390 [Spirochaetales bacterium]|nr:hypothetical protein [Spirochaetales bacterium]
MNKKIFLLCVAFTIVFLSACVTTPAKIDQDPGRYNGTLVKVRGEVEKIYKIPLTDISVFLLRDDEIAVPVVSLVEREEGGKVVVNGEVWAFPEEGMNAGSIEAVEAVEGFLVENDLVGKERGRQVAALVLTAVQKLAAGLGEIWFIIEK